MIWLLNFPIPSLTWLIPFLFIAMLVFLHYAFEAENGGSS